MMMMRFGLILLAGATSALTISNAQEDGASPDTSIAVEALKRLQGIDLDANPAVKNAVLKVLESTRGTPQFVEIVRDFKIGGQEKPLLEFAAQHPRDPSAPEAVRWVLENSDRTELKSALQSTNPAVCVPITDLLGKLSEPKAAPLLESLIVDAALPVAQRRAAVAGLARLESGAQYLLDLAQAGKLPADLKLTASLELSHVRWPEIQAKASKLLPRPAGQNSQPLPPISELVKMRGDPVRGRAVFFRQTSVCSTCHRINGQGADFGPNLSEIGTKLGKEAIYDAILEPSAGISFGYEGWEVESKDGEEAFGIQVSETADEIAIKSQTGVITHFKKADLVRRQQSKISIMPEGLQQTMTRQDFVDLVEFLSSLKKN